MSDVTPPNASAMRGWSGVGWEPSWKCDYCGTTVSERTGPLVRQIKKAHREICDTRCDQIVTKQQEAP